jgi:hypothetical protein
MSVQSISYGDQARRTCRFGHRRVPVGGQVIIAPWKAAYEAGIRVIRRSIKVKKRKLYFSIADA